MPFGDGSQHPLLLQEPIEPLDRFTTVPVRAQAAQALTETRLLLLFRK